MPLDSRILLQFSLGQTVITPTALALLSSCQVADALVRHARGDWGEVSPEDAAENIESLGLGGRLLSAFSTREGIKFWIITEADRSVTTVLLPEDY